MADVDRNETSGNDTVTERTAQEPTNCEEAETVNPLRNEITSRETLRRDNELNAPSGFLMKKSRVSRRWKKQWFCLKHANLYYGNSHETANKKICLNLAEISESSIDKKHNVFRVRPRDCKRTYYMQAADKQSLNLWMQAICFAKAASQDTDHVQACVIQ